MALYDNKYWLLSHIRNSFISTDDTGMCELVMVGENLPKQLIEKLDCYPDTDESLEEDDIEHESYDIQLDMDYSVRHRSNTAARLEKMDLVRKRAAKTKNVKWQEHPGDMTREERDVFFARKDPSAEKRSPPKRSLLAEQIKSCGNIPQNPFKGYAKYDGSAQVGIPVRKYKIFLTNLPEEQRNYPMTIVCIATAKIQELIGLILLKCSQVHGDFPLQPVTNYGLYITEEDGEVDRDFPCLDPKECVAKFGFSCLGLVEHKNVTFTLPEPDSIKQVEDTESPSASRQEIKQMTADMQLLKVHKSAMEAPLYQCYRVYIINKMIAKIEIHLGISGEKIEIDPVHQKSSKFTFARQKAVSHHMDSIAWCEVLESKSNKSTFRIVYSLSFGVNLDVSVSSLQSSASFKHYDFEADNSTAEEITQKINLILEIRSSVSRKEYIATRERKQMPCTEDEWRNVAKDFLVSWNYPHCVGACDGKHVVMQNPKNSGSMFFNYKGTFSIVLMAIVDANYNFIYANIGCQGRISDGGVFLETSFYKKLTNGNQHLPRPEPLPNSNKLSPYVILTDDVFPLQEHIMKPFSGYHNKGSCQRLYNYRHSRARRVVENSFGLLASVFRVFRKPLMVNVENAEIITTTCIYLHNFLRRNKTLRSLHSPPGTIDIETKDGNIIPGSWRTVIEGDTGLQDLQHRARRSTLEAKEVRNEVMRYFQSDEGRVPWQDLYV